MPPALPRPPVAAARWLVTPLGEDPGSPKASFDYTVFPDRSDSCAIDKHLRYTVPGNSYSCLRTFEVPSHLPRTCSSQVFWALFSHCALMCTLPLSTAYNLPSKVSLTICHITIFRRCSFGSQAQWAICGESFPLGCAFSPELTQFEAFCNNPDRRRRLYTSHLGMYTK